MTRRAVVLRVSAPGNWGIPWAGEHTVRLPEPFSQLTTAHVRIATHVQTREQVACKILPALHWDPNIAADWNATLDAVEAHKEVVILKAFAGAKVPGVVELVGVLEEGGWT